MLELRSLEVEGFGPFADQQVLRFPAQPGVTVVYGENMRGKTSLLNAIRYAFFGTVLGRGARARRLHSISNRERAADGRFGFTVVLRFDHDGDVYELVRTCKPNVPRPERDEDYTQEVMLRRGTSVLGPQEREHALHQVFPKDISRFFLFDGELLQEYEELLIHDSDSGHRISESIERILGVPILKRGRTHLVQLAEEADKAAAKEASKRHETQTLGDALQTATDQKQAHQQEAGRLQEQLTDLTSQRVELEEYLRSKEKYARLLQESDSCITRLQGASAEEATLRTELQRCLANAWRSLLREPVRAARQSVQEQARTQMDALLLSLRARAVESGHCATCEQDVPDAQADHLRTTLSESRMEVHEASATYSTTLSRLAQLGRFDDADNAGEVRRICVRLAELQIEQATLRDRQADLKTALSDADPEALRRSNTSWSEVLEKILAVKRALAEENDALRELDQSIQRINRKLEAIQSEDLRAAQVRAKALRDAAEVFATAVETYKGDLRSAVQTTASELFLLMTTEKQDYAGLTINDSYGLTIRHRDGQAEEARSAGAEHVVALALMGALQRNAPLRGPIVMDSPFGRLDDGHTRNVIQTLPNMAQQVVLFVYEAEVGRDQMRALLGNHLLREYELQRVSARRTNLVDLR